MKRIEDERIKFYLEHETRIREWAALEPEVAKVVDRFYLSLEDDLRAALRSGKIADNGIEVVVADGKWGGLGLRRQDWPEGDGEPDVRLEWFRRSARFSEDERLICGVRTNVQRYKAFFTKEARPAYPRSSAWWPAYRQVDPPAGRFWEGDNLKDHRDDLVQTILTAWSDLARLVDEAVGYSSS